MIIVIGEILIDRFPDDECIGGAPFNFAFHLKNMGWPVRFITRIGDDAEGTKIKNLLTSSGFNTQDIQSDKAHPTGRVEVTLDSNGVPRFDICENVAYDYIDLSSISAQLDGSVSLIYYGTLIQRTTNGFDQVQHFLKQVNKGTRRFCDINFRAPHINIEAVESSLYHADTLKLNDEELENISAIFKGPSRKEETIGWLIESYQISQVALTQGAEGSTVFEGGGIIHSPSIQTSKIIDTVGAGDAYAAVLASGILKQLPTAQTLELATSFAAQICKSPGAIPKGQQAYTSLNNKFERILNAQ